MMDFSDNSQALLQAMRYYCGLGFSCMWALAESKKPFITTWIELQETRLDDKFLLKQLTDNPNIDLVPALICGAVSQNLEIIDIDVKHWPGIDAIFFTEIKSLYPDLFDKLRIHRTPSGGFHILYKTDKPTGDGSKKLAYHKEHKESGIETRGEGGYALAPPGAGYTIHQDRPIPTITIEQRHALIALAKSLDQRQKPKKYAPAAKAYSTNYQQNPFSDFNHSPEGRNILLDNGWELYRDTENIAYFTRPGKKTGCSATYIKEKGIFHVFTSSTALEPDKNYDPTGVLATLQFNDDYKKTFRYLVQQGFGKFTPEYEKRKITQHVVTGKELPPNFSDQAKTQFLEAKKAHEEQYPHGIFWHVNDKGNYSIMRSELIDVCNALGLRFFRQDPVFIEYPFYEIISERKAYDIVLNYINEDDEYQQKLIIHALDAFWQYSGKYILSRLILIDENQLLKSTKDICYKTFIDKILKISAKGVEVTSLDSWDGGYIDVSSIIDVKWEDIENKYDKGYESQYEIFLRKAISVDGGALRRCIGYLCYDWTDETEARIISLAEDRPSRYGGGSGKGLFCQLLGLWSKVKTTDGMLIRKPEVLMQSWKGERIMHLNDLPRRVDLSVLKAMVSEGTEVKRLWKNMRTVGIREMPKLVISGQYGMNVFEDGGVKRRMEILSFSGYYGEERRPTDAGEFGGRIPECWGEKDWAGYYKYIIGCIQEYMRVREVGLFAGRSEEVWSKDFDVTYGGGQESFREWMEEKLEKWLKREDILGRQSYVTLEEIREAYEKYCRSYNIRQEMRIGRVQEALRDYCERHGIGWKKKHVRVSGVPTRVIEFSGEWDKADDGISATGYPLEQDNEGSSEEDGA